MIIKSDFRDYYDGLQQYDEDRATRFLRKREESVLKFKHNERSPSVWMDKYSDCNYSIEWIGFCGVIYPLISKHTFRENNIHITYGIEAISKFLNAGSVLTKFRRAWAGRMSNSGPKQYTDPNTNNPQYWFDLYGSIFHLYAHNTDYREMTLIKNPHLGKLGFAKILPPHLAYNALQRWVYTQASPEKPIPTMSNDIKIEQAGFDLKKSFRKPKAGDVN